MIFITKFIILLVLQKLRNNEYYPPTDYYPGNASMSGLTILKRKA